MTDSYFSVTDFGALGDGVADDTAAVQAAAQAARRASIAAGTSYGARGATLFFPRGQYRVSESLHFDGTYGLRLLGEGSLGGIGSAESATLLFTQAAGPGDSLLSARGSSNFQIDHLDLQYESPGMLGTLVALDGTFGDDAAYSDGVVSVETGSADVVLAGGAWPASAPRMRAVTVGGVPYRAVLTSPTTAVLDSPYTGPTDPATTYQLLPGNDTSNPVVENVHFGGPAGTGVAAALLSLNMTIGAVVTRCVFDFADNGIVGHRHGGWGSFTTTISDSTFLRLRSGAGIRNPGGVWLVESCTFEPAYYYDDGPVGILCDSGEDDHSLSWMLTVNNCWFGDGGGQDLRPWVSFNGFILNFTNNHVASAGPNQPLILVNGYGGTVHNVNISGNYLAPDNTSPAIRTGVATIESMTLCGNWWGYGTELVSDPASRIQSLTVIDTGARTDFRTGFHEYARAAKSGVPTAVAFDIATFTAPGGTWSLAAEHVVTLSHSLVGQQLTLWFDLAGTALTGPAAELRVTLPDGRRPAFACTAGSFEYDDGSGTWRVGVVRTADDAIVLTKPDQTEWSDAPLLSVRGMAVVPLAAP